jgi:competence protein ComEC
LVLYLQDKGNGMLLTGDLERGGVGALLAAGFPGPVSLLKLPHHGSRHSGTEKLLNRLRPQYCLVSAGYKNRYRLPAEQLLTYLTEMEIALFRTDLQGTIRAESTATGWQISY